jgi:hypothetical protein
LAGWIFDTRGSYDLAIGIFMLTTLLAGVIVFLLRLPERPGEAAEPAAGPAGQPAAATRAT